MFDACHSAIAVPVGYANWFLAQPEKCPGKRPEGGDSTTVETRDQCNPMLKSRQDDEIRTGRADRARRQVR